MWQEAGRRTYKKSITFSWLIPVGLKDLDGGGNFLIIEGTTAVAEKLYLQAYEDTDTNIFFYFLL